MIPVLVRVRAFERVSPCATAPTNVDTGAFVTITGNAIFNEIKATHLTGNVFEFDAVEAGQPFELYDSNGNLVARDRGSIHHHAVFDTGGDNVPGGHPDRGPGA